MGAVASQITSLTIVYSTIYSDADQRKHQGSASLAFVRGIHQGPVNSLHKGPVTRKMFPFDDAIMLKFSDAHDHHDGAMAWAFSASPTPCEGNPPVNGEFPSHRDSDVAFFFVVSLNKLLNKHSILSVI